MMAIALSVLVLILCASNVACWTYTEYVTVVTTAGFAFPSTTALVTVTPTGPVTPTSTEITTAEASLYYDPAHAVINITVTALYLGPGASVCTSDDYQCVALTTAATLASTINTIGTGVWAAVTISNPSTCTQTSFTYTTSSVGILGNLGNEVYQTPFPTILNQVTDTGPNGEALFVTTYIVTTSVDLGGQALTSTTCEIWLKNGALQSIPLQDDEVHYLVNCVDPRRYLCSGNYDSSATCGTDWIGTYPMMTGTVTSVRAASTRGTSGGTASSSTAKAGGVAGGQDLLYGGFIFTALTAITSLCNLLC